MFAYTPLVKEFLAKCWVSYGVYAIMQCTWVRVNLNCTDSHAILELANDMKMHIFTTQHKANTSMKCMSQFRVTSLKSMMTHEILEC